MSLWSRIVNAFRGDRLSREIEEELESHIAEAIAEGRDFGEARRAFGPALHHREKSRDIRIMPWLESVYADAVFGRRQLLKRKGTSAAAILSLALAIGSCAAAFRLMDAVLWRPLPVAAPERHYVLSRQSTGPDGKVATGDTCAYPMFRQVRALVKDQAELIAVSIANRIDVTYGSDQETEKAYQQYVSGWMFGSFGIRPALGRVFRSGNDIYQIVGVAEGPFVGTEPGTVTDIFVPTMMMKNRAIVRSDYRWFRTFVQLKPGVSALPVREKLRAAFRAFLEESVKVYAAIPKRELDGYMSQKLLMNAAPAGVSGMQRVYGTALSVLGVLVMLVLLIACANVANLMTAAWHSSALDSRPNGFSH